MILVPRDDDACLCERGDVEGEGSHAAARTATELDRHIGTWSSLRGQSDV